MIIQKQGRNMVPAHQEVIRKPAGDLTVADQLPLGGRVKISVTVATKVQQPRRLPRAIVNALGLAPTVTRVHLRFTDGSRADWSATRKVKVLANRKSVHQLVA